MSGPLAGGSPGNREIGRLGTCEVREIGRLEGPGPGLPPRTPIFLQPSPKTMGSESAPVLKSYYVPTLLVLWGRNWVAGAPFSAVAKGQRWFPRNLLCSGPPDTAGYAAAVPGRRGGRGIEKSSKGQRGERLQTTRGECVKKKRKDER